jgi:MFS family permease
MITLTYIGSAVAVVVLAVVFAAHTGGPWTFIAVLAVAFFIASAGASAAYLTVSEIFPMETRALAIAFFYAVGTAIGGISGPLLFGQLINSGQREMVVWSFVIGAIVMAVAGLVELWLGIAAEQRPLEELALPLTVADAEDQDQPAQGQRPTS